MVLCTIEGLDGSGKGTAIDALNNEFDAVFTTEPTEMWTGKKLRELLADESVDPLMDFYMFMVDRVNHVDTVIKPHDGLVISDRYADSTRAYQPPALVEAGVFGTQKEAKEFINETMRPWNYEPDLTIYLDVSVDTAMDRAAGDEKYEKRQFLSNVRLNYEELVRENKDRFVRVNAEHSKEEVADAVVTAVDSVMCGCTECGCK